MSNLDGYDFSGWATRANVKCSDGRTILKDAFKHNDGCIVPLVWNHRHDSADNVLGHALLENRDEGVYAYGTFNNTEEGQRAKELVIHGDIRALSIYANQLKERDGYVSHGSICELSLVLKGANKGALIMDVIKHSEDTDGEAIFAFGADNCLLHTEVSEEVTEEVAEEVAEPETKTEEVPEENLEHSEKGEAKMTEEVKKEKTVQDVYDSMDEEQKNVCHYMIQQALEDAEKEKNTDGEGEEKEMKHNVFEGQETNNQNALSHADMEAIIKDGKRCGSLKEAVLAHGIDNIEYLFPEAKSLNNPPEWIKRDTGWVGKVMGAVHHTPFSRIKSQFADITEDDARAKGYIKGKYKKEEVFGLLKRTTTPTTVYKKQKLDRDDIIDITDFDVVAWLKGEMRFMLDEELARAFLIGDGRLASSDDKINETHIRPVVYDEDLYCVKAHVKVKAGATDDVKAKAFIRSVIKERKNYKGSGNPTLYTTEYMVSECLLLEDGIGHFLYPSLEALKNTLRVKEIVEVPVMEGVKGKNGGDLAGVLVNLVDYNVGADKGGAINMFDDFDIDYNQQKYLIETRCSGALIKPYSAIAFEFEEVAGE